MCLKTKLANRGHEIIQTFVTAGSHYYPSGRENKNGKIVLEELRKEEMEACMADSHTSEVGVGGWVGGGSVLKLCFIGLPWWRSG